MSDTQKVLFGVFVVIVLSIVLVPLGGLLGYSAGHSAIGWWLIATGTPTVVFAFLVLLFRGPQPEFAKGLMIGLCIVFLVTGICSGIATNYGRDVPSMERW